MKKTWRQLKAEGVTRCCATFTSGKQCRRRAITGENWCKNHINFFRTLQEINKEAIKQEETFCQEMEKARNSGLRAIAAMLRA